MKAPDKIFLTNGDDEHPINFDTAVPLELLMWCENKVTDFDVEYIRKDMLLEWAKELTSEPYDRTTESARKHQIAHYLHEKYNSL